MKPNLFGTDHQIKNAISIKNSIHNVVESDFCDLSLFI